MKPFRLLLSIVILSLAGVAAAQDMPDKDIPGSHDHPLVSRFAGSLITGYQTVDYDRMLLPLGKTVDDKLSKSDTAEGRITRISYVAPPRKERAGDLPQLPVGTAVGGLLHPFLMRR